MNFPWYKTQIQIEDNKISSSLPESAEPYFPKFGRLTAVDTPLKVPVIDF